MNLTADYYPVTNFGNQTYTPWNGGGGGVRRRRRSSNHAYWYHPFNEYSLNNHPSSSSSSSSSLLSTTSTGVYLPFHVYFDTQTNTNNYDMNELHYHDVYNGSESSMHSIDDTSLLLHSYYTTDNTSNHNSNNESICMEYGMDCNLLLPTTITNHHLLPISLSLSSTPVSLSSSASSSSSSSTSSEVDDTVNSVPNSSSIIITGNTVNDSISSASLLSTCWSDNSTIREVNSLSNQQNHLFSDFLFFSNNNNNTNNISNTGNDDITIQNNKKSLSNFSFQFKLDNEHENELLTVTDDNRLFQKSNNCQFEYQQYDCLTRHETNNNNNDSIHYQSSLCSEILKPPLSISTTTCVLPVKVSCSTESNKLIEQPNYAYGFNGTQKIPDKFDIIDDKYRLSSTMKLTNLIDQCNNDESELIQGNDGVINKNHLNNESVLCNPNTVKTELSNCQLYSPSLMTSTSYLNSQTKFSSDSTALSLKSFEKSLVDMTKEDNDKITLKQLCFEYTTKESLLQTDIHKQPVRRRQTYPDLLSGSSSSTLSSREMINHLNCYNQNCNSYIDRGINGQFLLHPQDLCNSTKMHKLDYNKSSTSELTLPRSTTMTTETTSTTTTSIKSMQPYKWLQIKRQQPRQNIINNSKLMVAVIYNKLQLI
ncbi:unnamed protein product [Schistosoma turkestanicum]|nr:unnamed protein product [Schistosoma turkestanicum]